MPNDGLDDGDENSANERALAEMRAEIEGGGSPEEGDESPAEIEVGAEIDDDEPEERGTRKERRAVRGRRHREKAREQLEESKAETRRLREDLAEMRGRQSAMEQQGRPGAPQGNQFDTEMEEEERLQKETLAGYNAANASYAAQGKAMPADENDGWMRRNNKHYQNMGAVGARREYASQNSPEKRAHDQINAQYPDVMNHDKAGLWAINRYRQKQLEGDVGPGSDPAAVAKVMDEARRQFRIGNYNAPPPTEQQNSSYGRVGRAGSGAAPKRGERIQMTPEKKRMARAMYGHTGWSDAKMFQTWANDQAE